MSKRSILHLAVLLTAYVAVAVGLSACGGDPFDDLINDDEEEEEEEVVAVDSAPPAPMIDEFSPGIYPARGMGVTLTIEGRDFSNSAEVWADLDRSNPRKLHVIRKSSTEILANAPADLIQPGNVHINVVQSSGTSNTARFDMVGPFCSEGSQGGSFVETSNLHGANFYDATHDGIRFLASNNQMVAHGNKVANTFLVADGGDWRVYIGDQHTFSIRSVTVDQCCDFRFNVLFNASGSKIVDLYSSHASDGACNLSWKESAVPAGGFPVSPFPAGGTQHLLEYEPGAPDLDASRVFIGHGAIGPFLMSVPLLGFELPPETPDLWQPEEALAIGAEPESGELLFEEGQ